MVSDLKHPGCDTRLVAERPGRAPDVQENLLQRIFDERSITMQSALEKVAQAQGEALIEVMHGLLLAGSDPFEQL
jgi:hypothetical protein